MINSVIKIHQRLLQIVRLLLVVANRTFVLKKRGDIREVMKQSDRDKEKKIACATELTMHRGFTNTLFASVAHLLNKYQMYSQHFKLYGTGIWEGIVDDGSYHSSQSVSLLKQH